MKKLFHEKYKRQIFLQAVALKAKELPVLTEELFAVFEKTGNRLEYENVYFTRRKYLAVFGMAALVFGREDDISKLSEVIASVCQEECWALPAHVNRREDADWRLTVDLFAAETAQTLAEIICFVNSQLPEEKRLQEALCDRVHTEIERRVLIPFFTSEPNYGCWECADHNWNAVCSGAIGSVCIYLMEGKEEERLNKCLERLCHSLAYYLEGFKEDGACMEGIGYFTYGMTYYVGFAEQLLRYSKGKINLFENEKLRRIAEFQQKMYFSGGQTVSFSDGEKQAKFRMGLTSFLANKYDSVTIPEDRLAADLTSDACYRFMGLLRDYLWRKEIKEQGNIANDRSRHDVFPCAQWSICETNSGVGFAIKGGDNGEAHNHNDVGSFLYIYNGEQLIADLGAGEYTKEYFGTGRYEILCNSSMGHSVPNIDGKLQQVGKEYGTSLFEADGAGYTKLEFGKAYPVGIVNSLTRETAFDLKTGELMVTDSYELPKGVRRFTEQLVTQGQVKIEWTQEGSTISITKGDSSCEVILPAELHHLYSMDEVHTNHEGEAEIVRLIRWDVFLEPGQENQGSTWFKIIPMKN